MTVIWKCILVIVRNGFEIDDFDSLFSVYTIGFVTWYTLHMILFEMVLTWVLKDFG